MTTLSKNNYCSLDVAFSLFHNFRVKDLDIIVIKNFNDDIL